MATPYPTHCQNPKCGTKLKLMIEPLTAYWLKENKHLCHTCYHGAYDKKAK